jgi:8-oxo-dGTP pyrophosphatase MutT (NUDIX family)
MSLSKNICLNCGKMGHQHKQCNDPIISCGIICFNICPELNISNKLIENYFFNKFIDISEFNYINIDNIKHIPYFYDKIKILMVRHKHSLNYIDFIRGKYSTNDEKQINKLFQLMTQDENLLILNSDFDNLWNDLWKETAKNKLYQKEYILSKNKFAELKLKKFYNLIALDKLSKYTEPEWGFPKGRRNANEMNLQCAIREFTEETNIDISDLHVLERLNYINEEYVGTNQLNYRHIYYVASSPTELELNTNDQINEIGKVEWFTIQNAIDKIRPYNNTRTKIIHQLYFFLINLIISIKNNTNTLVQF